MIEELYNQSSFLYSHIMAGTVKRKISPGSSASVDVKAGSAMVGYKSCYFLGARLDASTVNSHDTQWTF
jgi:hypothetical protein